MRANELRKIYKDLTSKVSAKEGVFIFANVDGEWFWGGAGGKKEIIEVIMQAMHEDAETREMIQSAVNLWEICESKSGLITGDLNAMPAQVLDIITNDDN